MKLIYQHMLSFFLIILTTVTIIGYSEIDYAAQQSYGQNYHRLEQYAAALGAIAVTDEKDGTLVLNAGFLSQLQFVLHSDDLHLRVFDTHGQQLYPKARQKNQLAPKVLRTLQQGKEIRIQNNNDAPVYFGHTKDSYTGVLVPWLSKKKMIGAIWLGSRIASIERPINAAKHKLISALVIAMLVGLVLSLLLSFYSSNKIKRLSQATKKVAAGNFNVQLDYFGNDEIDQLAANFNQMVRTLKKSNEEIKDQEKRRDQFLADAAHEMRTPLTTINGILEGLEYDAIPEESKPKSIALMRRETERLIRLVNENLDFEKIRNNQIILTKTTFNASKVLEDVAAQLKQNADKEKDQLVLLVPANLPIYADRDRFMQIMVNIVQNAIQFTHDGQIMVSGQRLKHGTQVVVNDNGIGMSTEQMKYIFERFFKADPSRARLGTGESGLGLSIVASLIKQHGGQIKVDSQPDQGAQFCMIFYDQGYEQYLAE